MEKICNPFVEVVSNVYIKMYDKRGFIAQK